MSPLEEALAFLIGPVNTKDAKLRAIRIADLYSRAAEGNPRSLPMHELRLLQEDLIRLGVALGLAAGRTREIVRLTAEIQDKLGPSGHVLYVKHENDGVFVEDLNPPKPEFIPRVVH